MRDEYCCFLALLVSVDRQVQLRMGPGVMTRLFNAYLTSGGQRLQPVLCIVCQSSIALFRSNSSIQRQTGSMKRLLVLLPLLLGSQVTPASASTYSESFGYEEGYKACIRSNFTGMPRDDWNSKSKLEKDHFRAWVHQNCK